MSSITLQFQVTRKTTLQYSPISASALKHTQVILRSKNCNLTWPGVKRSTYTPLPQLMWFTQVIWVSFLGLWLWLYACAYVSLEHACAHMSECACACVRGQRHWHAVPWGFKMVGFGWKCGRIAEERQMAWQCAYFRTAFNFISRL